MKVTIQEAYLLKCLLQPMLVFIILILKFVLSLDWFSWTLGKEGGRN